jgi:predicted tellurium resistance membrane protein TerC
MLTGKMTATWLILLTIAGCAAVPVLLIYYTTVHPFVDTHPPKITLGLVDLIPKAITIGLVNPVST